MNTIIHWNLQSYYTHFSDLKLLIRDYSPGVICLQETLIKQNRQTYPPSQYNILTSNVTRNDSHERGSAILIHQNIFHQKINLDTNLQAVATRVMIGKLYSVCSIYIPHLPTDNLKRDLSHLIDQLPQPFLLSGDLNARSPM